MKVLDKVSLRAMLSHRKDCPICLGKGYLFYLKSCYDMTKFREVVPCSCVRQTIRISEDAR